MSLLEWLETQAKLNHITLPTREELSKIMLKENSETYSDEYKAKLWEKIAMEGGYECLA